MIAGVGLDLVSVSGFASQCADLASTFVQGTFTPGERADALAAPGSNVARHLAARFAAKEAFLKAWASSRSGAAPAVAGLDMRHIEVIRDPWGRPALRLHDVVASLCRDFRTHLSLSHDGDMAAAVVVLEAGSTPAPVSP